MEEMEDDYCWKGKEGFYKGNCLLGNFFPELKSVQEIEGVKEVVIRIHFDSGGDEEVTLPVKKIKRADWFELCQRCIVNEDNKQAQKLIRQFVCRKVAEYEGRVAMVTQYKQLGWNADVFGNNVYVFGNCRIGGDKEARISPALQEYELQFWEEGRVESLSVFINLWREAPFEAKITIGYFFLGLIRQIYKDAGLPVDFSLYLKGRQQNRKTTLAKITNNLYCRQTDMDFSVRTVGRISSVTAEKLISLYKDTTLILDDVSRTADKKYKKEQESIVENVVRMVGNKARKSLNSGNGTKDFSPNANVIITGEYLPNFPESVLSRMLIIEIEEPVDSSWLIEFGQIPEMLSTVAYEFLSWIQPEYENYVEWIRRKFDEYRQRRKNRVPYHERIQEHGFILQSAYYIMYDFFIEKGFSKEISMIMYTNTRILHNALKNQVQLMKKYALPDKERNFCYAFAELYCKKNLAIADDHLEYEDKDDGFRLNKHIICISTEKMCAIMQHYYKDNSITIKQVTKEFRNNNFLDVDSSKNTKSTKKVDGKRYLHIIKAAVKDYHKYCCRES